MRMLACNPKPNTRELSGLERLDQTVVHVVRLLIKDHQNGIQGLSIIKERPTGQSKTGGVTYHADMKRWLR
jgi:hypothetical protein